MSASNMPYTLNTLPQKNPPATGALSYWGSGHQTGKAPCPRGNLAQRRWRLQPCSCSSAQVSRQIGGVERLYGLRSIWFRFPVRALGADRLGLSLQQYSSRKYQSNGYITQQLFHRFACWVEHAIHRFS